MDLSPAPNADTSALSAPARVWSVADVVVRIRTLIAQAFTVPLWIEGELSNCSYPASGHIYFTLVDEQMTDRFGQRLVLPCAFYRGVNQQVKFRLTDGMKVLCLGQVTTYERQGQYQLRVLRVEPKGVGAFQLAFDQLKQRLEAEGLFAPQRKRPIPMMPQRVGLITSKSGSAIHDLVSKLREWFHLIILPVKVQGDGAAQDIVQALEVANRLRIADVLIVGRGGGSVEDLWAFNEEGVARAIAASRIPVISAVGHEDDWTIADYIADLRASTPTDAAKRLVQTKHTLMDQTHQLTESLVHAMQLALQDEQARLDALASQLRLLHPRVQLERYHTWVRERQDELLTVMHHQLDRSQQELQTLVGTLHALSPLAVLGRGYSITRTLPQRHVVMSAPQVKVGEALETLLSSGRLESCVTFVGRLHEAGTDGADA